MSRTRPSTVEATKRLLNGGAWLVLLLFVTPAPLLGYIDPVSGSIILQVLAAGLFAGLMTVKRFWFQVKTQFGRLRAILVRR